MSKNFDARIAEWREQIDDKLSAMISFSAYPKDFKEILEYAVFPGGKRLRPILFLEWHSLYAPPDDAALKFACAIELMHCYSLIHDDMPCMDNDELRRGKPTVHKKYGEGKALLAGDALLDMSYNAMFDASISTGCAKPSAYYNFSGDTGIVHGQYLDLYSKVKTLEELIEVYEKKTASLIKSACLAGYLFTQNITFDEYVAAVGICCDTAVNNIDPASVSGICAAMRFGELFGVAFQLYDDISEYVAGEQADGPSILDFLDLEKAKTLLNTYLNQASSELDKFENSDVSFLKELVNKFIIV